MPRVGNLAILDDHQGRTGALGPWESLPHVPRTTSRDTLSGEPDSLLARLRLLVTAGERNRAVDAAALRPPRHRVLRHAGLRRPHRGPDLGPDPVPAARHSRPAGGAERVAKDALFREADVLSIHLILSERTRGLAGARG